MCEVWLRVSVDHNLHAALFGHPQVHVTEIEPVGISVSIHRHVVLGGSAEDCVHVIGICVASKQDASRRMSNDGDALTSMARMRRSVIFAGSLLEVRVDAGYHKIHLRENVGREVQIAINEDVHFDPAKILTPAIALSLRGFFRCA